MGFSVLKSKVWGEINLAEVGNPNRVKTSRGLPTLYVPHYQWRMLWAGQCAIS